MKTSVSELLNTNANTTDGLGFKKAGILTGADNIDMQTNETNGITSVSYILSILCIRR